MEALDFAAFGSFVALAVAWVILPLKAPVATSVAPAVTAAVALESAA